MPCCPPRCLSACGRRRDPARWLAVLVPVLHLGTGHRSPTYLVSLLGKYLAYAILALALDLVWGYCGILSLGHGAFFALGGYGMGMYLMRQIGPAASTATRSCPTSWSS